jgi:hypothetical protein
VGQRRQQQQQHGRGCEEGCDEQHEQLSRLTRTNSWVIGVARSLNFGGSCEGSCSHSDEEGGHEGQGAGVPQAEDGSGSQAGSCVGTEEGGPSTDLSGCEQQLQAPSGSEDTAGELQLQLQSSSGGAGTGPRSDTAAPPPAAGAAAAQGGVAHQQQGQLQQQQGDLALPVTYWHNDMLAGIWGSSLSVVSGGDQVSTRSSTGSGISPGVAPAELVAVAASVPPGVSAEQQPEQL